MLLNILIKNKATGPDTIHNRLLIAAADVISEPLTNLFNRSLNESKFPSQWKIANVTPIHKEEQKELCGNYRPISLLSCVFKVLERCVPRHLYSFLQVNRIITPSLSGFIPGDSSVKQLVCIYNDLCSSFDSGTTAQTVFFDISKAFDRVWHKGLLVKLKAIGSRGLLLEWFCDYLTNRIQTVVINGEKYRLKRVVSGVPKGSVLGPLLFLICINDINNDIQSVIKLFADDTSMSLALKTANVRADIMNSELQKINHWVKKWKVKFNEEKTKLLNCVRDQNIVLPLKFEDITLRDTAQHKHLGITLQNNCTWDEYIRSIASKVNLLISCLRSYKYRLTRKT